MSIETVGNFNKMLKDFNTQDWMSSVKMDKVAMPQTGAAGDVNGNKSFSEMLSSSLMEVNNMQVEANKAIEKLASGQSKDVSGTLLAVEKAEIAFKTMNQVRMKVIEAYKEVMRMQM